MFNLMKTKAINLKKVKAVCFDFGNTLADNDALFLNGSIFAARKMCVQLGVVWDPFRYFIVSQKAVSIALRKQEKIYGNIPASELDSQRSGEMFVETFCGQLLALAGRKPAPALVKKLAAAYYDGLARSNCIYPKTREVLYTLKKNCKLAVVSNNPVEYVLPPLKASGLDGLFSEILVSGELGLGVVKPCQSIFNITMKRLGVEPGETVMVGDSMTDDVYGANKAGMISVWLKRSNNRHQEKLRGVCRPDFIITDISDLLHIFSNNLAGGDFSKTSAKLVDVTSFGELPGEKKVKSI